MWALETVSVLHRGLSGPAAGTLRTGGTSRNGMVTRGGAATSPGPA
jgi:hypothetical protein